MSRARLPQLSRIGTADRIANLLADSIVTGEIEAGTHLREQALSEELGVARNTVREAIRILEHSGLVQHLPQRGAHVTKPTAAQIESLYRARLLLEIGAVRSPFTDDALARLQQATERQERATGDTERVEADLGFHGAVVALADNDRIDRIYAALMRELQFFLHAIMLADPNRETARDSLGEHRAIVDACRARDIDLAERLLTEHCERHSKRSIEIFSRFDAEHRE